MNRALSIAASARAWRFAALLAVAASTAACTNSAGSIPDDTAAETTVAGVAPTVATIPEPTTTTSTTTTTLVPPTTIPHGGGVLPTLISGEPMNPAALATARSIYDAAIIHDYEAIRTIIGDRRFRWGFVGDRDPAGAWKKQFEEGNGDELARAVALLDVPAGVDSAGNTWWPYLAVKPIEEWGPAEDAVLVQLGFNPEDILQTKAKGRYVDYRLRIDPEGIWNAFGVGW